MQFGTCEQQKNRERENVVFLPTVYVQIERHSWLERQGTVLGRTMVIFGSKMSKRYSIYRLQWVKNDQSAEPKIPKSELNAVVLFAQIR